MDKTFEQPLPIHIQELIDRGCTQMAQFVANRSRKIMVNFDQRASDLGYEKVIRKIVWTEDYLNAMNNRLKKDNESPVDNDSWEHQQNNRLWFNAYLTAIARDLSIHRKVSRDE